MKKVAIIGAGNVGAEAAAALFRLCTCRIVLIDQIAGLAEGKAMDIRQSANLVASCSLLTGSNALPEMSGSDMIVITAGSPRKTGMSRFDLLKVNEAIVLELGKSIRQYAPGAVICLVTNPVDLLTAILKRAYPELNLFGFGCSLDSYRFRYFIGAKLQINPSIITGLIIGTHDPDMIPCLEGTSVGGIPVTALLTQAELDNILVQTVEAGNEIVKQLKNTGSFYTAGQIIARIVKSVIEEIPEIFSVDVYFNDIMGFSGIALSLPAIIHKEGIRKTITLPGDGVCCQKLKLTAAKLAEILKAHDRERNVYEGNQFEKYF